MRRENVFGTLSFFLIPLFFYKKFINFFYQSKYFLHALFGWSLVFPYGLKVRTVGRVSSIQISVTKAGTSGRYYVRRNWTFSSEIIVKKCIDLGSKLSRYYEIQRGRWDG